jgi:type I restriction enzyme S subunit
MSQIDKLIAELCPNGVEFKAIGDFGELVRGNGMPKTDFVESGVGCIHYGQIYTHYGIWTTETKSFVPAAKAARLAKVDPGDLVITNTSENIEDVCKAVAWIGKSQIVTGGHATVLKHNQDPKYLSYYLQTPKFFAEKKKHATGTKVIDVSAKSLAKIKIPVPPLEVQREIVNILDAFTKLEAELEAELEARRRQYKYYRDALLTFGERPGAETADGRRQTADGRRQTADGRRQTADGRRQTADGRRR